MSAIQRNRIRLKIDTESSSPMVDVISESTPEHWRGEDVQYELGIFEGDVLADISDLSTITLVVKDNTSLTGAAIYTATANYGTFNPGLTLDDWNNEVSQHLVVTFTNAQTNVTLGANQKSYWITVHATTKDAPADIIVLGCTTLTIKEAGLTSSGSPPTPADLYFTADQCIARFQPIGAGVTGVGISEGSGAVPATPVDTEVMQIVVSTQGTFYYWSVGAQRWIRVVGLS